MMNVMPPLNGKVMLRLVVEKKKYNKKQQLHIRLPKYKS